MKYRIKFNPIFTTNSDTVISLSKKGYKLQAMTYFVTGSGKRFYSLLRTHL